LLKVASSDYISLKNKSIGVVGIGNIGSRVVRIAEALGMKVLKNDPPLKRIGVGNNYVDLEEALNTDIITLHVPMTNEGPDKTYHLLNEENLKQLKNGAMIINTSRGAVIDNTALLDKSDKKHFDLVLDVWESEPSVNNELLLKTKIATPHIAGYSFEGKVNGTKMVYHALCKFLNKEPIWTPSLPKIETNEMIMPSGKSDEEKLFKLFSSIYNIEKDDGLMRQIINLEQKNQPAYFDLMRKKYPIRREFSNYTVRLTQTESYLKSFLETIGFKVKVV